jgi:hypothetical protein
MEISPFLKSFLRPMIEVTTIILQIANKGGRNH